MLEKIMKNQEKMQDDIKLVKEEVAILSYDQDCVYVTTTKRIFSKLDNFIPAAQIQNPNAEIPNAEIPNPKSQIIISIFCRNPKSQIPNTNNLQKMLEKIMKNQEKMQDDIKLVKEEVAILSYDQDCVYVKSAQNLLEKIIYPTFDQFKETTKSFMEKSDINFFSSLGHRWEPFYHKKIRVDMSTPISIAAEASKISAWKKNPAISTSFRKLFDKVEEDEEDTYMTRIIKNVWPKKKNIPNLQIAWVISIAEIILNPNNENIKISEEIIKPVLLKNLNKIENNENFEYESDSSERLEVAPKRLAAPKKSAVPERPAAPRSNKRITEIETSRKEKKKIRSIRKDNENDDDDDEADEGDKAYEANETYETDEGDEYYNEIINIDESEEE
ncbi:hypothetical protein Glove_203g24 [Diversispora epigaea]|uniref:Uncharacterized protein n=1 Tax=Diversispora epigaea TaxID=1348612 RepID=A0A397IMP3_9GLOM|nr:hypothetical protein Glove_203g24 [Diversispora epigaea]